MKVIFAGTPEFAAVALQALIDSTHDVIAVYTQPDKPAGRGLKLHQSPVKELALQHRLPIYQPSTLKNEHEQKELAALQADVLVVAAYGLILPSAVLHAPPFGCINIHPSLLPRWRGAAPIQRTIFEGDTETAVTIMQMDEGLDTGPILLVKPYALVSGETSASLLEKLAHIGAAALVEALDLLAQQALVPQVQDNSKATYAQKIDKAEAVIDWMQPAKIIDQTIRAFNPWPVAHTSWQGENLRIWQAEVLVEKCTADPRTVLRASDKGIDVATGDGVLRILQVQVPGGKRISVADFYHAHQQHIVVGQHLL